MFRKRTNKTRFAIAFLLSLVVCFTAFSVVYAAAGTTGKEIKTTLNFGIPGSDIFNSGKEITITGATFGEYISALYVFFTMLAGIMATAMMVYGGFQYVVSRGNPGKMSNARDTISSAVTGLVLALGAYVILLTVNPRLVKFDGFELKSVDTVLQGLEGEMSSEKGAPPVEWKGGNVPDYDAIIAAYTTTYEERYWIKAIMLVESNGKIDAESGVGACGLMQLMPATATDIKKKTQLTGWGDPNTPVTCAELKQNPEESIVIALRYLRQLISHTCPNGSSEIKYKSGSYAVCNKANTKCNDGNYKYAVAAYNGGLGANCSSRDCGPATDSSGNIIPGTGQTWWECSSNPGYDETRKYVQKVQQAYDKISAGGVGFRWCDNPPCN